MTQTIINVPATFDPSDITLTDDTSGALLIKEGSNEYMRIDTTNGSEQMVLKGNPGGAGTLQYAGLFLVTNPYLQGSDNNNVRLTTSGIVLQTGNAGNRCDVYAINSGNSFRVLGTGAAERFKVLDDSNATFTLDDTSGAVFKVVDDNASPKTYFSATENGNIQVGDFTGSVNLNADATGVSLRSNKIELRNGSANPLVTFETDEVVYNGGGILIGDSYYGAPTDSTATETIADKEININQTFQYETTASAAGTVTVQFFTERSFYSDGTTPTLRMVTLLNKNATHNVTYIFNVRSGYGTAYAMDSNATSLIGGGLTLTPGQAAIFRLVTFNKTTTNSDAKHYFTTLGVG